MYYNLVKKRIGTKQSGDTIKGNIELKSEQVRKNAMQVLPVLVRVVSILSPIILLLLIITAFMPYAQTVESEVTVSEVYQDHAFAIGELPYSYISQVEKEMKVEIELEGYVNRKYGYQQGHIVSISPEIRDRNGEDYFRFTLLLKEIPFMQKGMKGKASIILSDKTLLKRILE